MKFNPLPFQQAAIDSLTSTFKTLWNAGTNRKELVFQSPTGSGKTLMMSNFIHELKHQPDWIANVAYVWITFSDDLAMQSKDKFYDYFFPNVENNLLTKDDFSQGKLKQNDILFINWQKLTQEEMSNRLKSRRSTDPGHYKETGYYFEDVFENTHAEKREIIMIIDESHKNSKTALAKDVINWIKPRIILNMSATPSHIPNAVELKALQAGYVGVDRANVIAEGLIKEQIVCQTEDDLTKDPLKDMDTLMLDLAIDKRKEVIAEYCKLGKTINPLILIQLPNDHKELSKTGLQTKGEIVLDYLKRRGVPDSHIAQWFDTVKKNIANISDNNNEVEFLLFKEAAGTGWDCPRAHILVMYRDIQSPVFYTQTLGRILRMAEPQCKEDYRKSPILRTGYLYTNYARVDVNIPDQTENNKPYLFEAINRKGAFILDPALQNDYISRVDYGDLADATAFQTSFLKSFNKFFNVNFSTIYTPAQIKAKCRARGLALNTTLTNTILVGAKFDDIDNLDLDMAHNGTTTTYQVSSNDAEKLFTALCVQLLREQTDPDAKVSNIARSWSPLKSALRVWLHTFIATDDDTCYRVFINDINTNQSSAFRQAVTQALKDYRPTLNSILSARAGTIIARGTVEFAFNPAYYFTEDYDKIANINYSLLQPFYMRKVYNGRVNELDFIKFLEGCAKAGEIDWWFKNGDSGQDYLGFKYFDTTSGKERLFYPDWIVMFKNKNGGKGKIGLFDTKGGITAASTETKDKAEALYNRIAQLNKTSKSYTYVGGIVVKANGLWYCNDANPYIYSVPLSPVWQTIQSLF